MDQKFEQIAAFLRAKAQLTADEVERTLQSVEVRVLAKKQYFIEQGQRAPYKGFLDKGCVRTFFTDQNGKDNIIFFSFEGAWLGDIESYHTHAPSRVSIQAIEDCRLFVLSKSVFSALQVQIPTLRRWYDFTAVKMYSSLFDKLIESKSRNVEDQYRFLLREHPQILQRIPLQYVADYLEIEPPSLSRLRKRIAQGERS